MWSLLLLTLPTQPNAVRLRVWRALKALGCGALRDGAYLLPAEHEALFEPLADEVRAHGGSATLLRTAARDEAQQRDFAALFDRGEAYAAWQREAEDTAARWSAEPESAARRSLRALADALAELQRIDYLPGAAAEQARAELAALRTAFDARFARGEPRAATEHAIERLERARFQGRRWCTRARPWVDRLACAWLIRRFVDEKPQFLWLADPSRAPRGALGFDYDGARFTHVGSKVSFEVLALSFGLERDAALARVAAVVHYLDAGGIPVPEAPGLEAVLAGLQALHEDDDALVGAAGAVFDALYATAGAAPRKAGPKRSP
ncbi:MAG: chromate resistance protein [Burkholderiales bacterium]|nr:chromate resistance protein [Burkholderiales bacterium]